LSFTTHPHLAARLGQGRAVPLLPSVVYSGVGSTVAVSCPLSRDQLECARRELQGIGLVAYLPAGQLTNGRAVRIVPSQQLVVFTASNSRVQAVQFAVSTRTFLSSVVSTGHPPIFLTGDFCHLPPLFCRRSSGLVLQKLM